MSARVHVDLDDLVELVRTLTAVVGELPEIATDLRAVVAEAGVAFGVDPAADVLRPRFAESARIALDALGGVESLMREHIESVEAAGDRLRAADASAAHLLGTRGTGARDGGLSL